MALNIKNPEVEKLAAQVAAMAKQTKTEAIRQALLDRKHRLKLRGAGMSRSARLRYWLEEEVWPHLPPDVLGRPISKEEEEEILGFGPGGV